MKWRLKKKLVWSFPDSMSGPERSAPRYRALAAALAAVVCLLFAGSAQATLRVELVWVSINGAPIPEPYPSVVEAEPGDELVLEIRIHVDSAGVQGYALSVAFDEDLMDELDIVSVEELDGVPTLDCEPLPACFTQNPLANLSVGVETETDSSGSVPGLVGSFEATEKSPEGPIDFMSPIGHITFVVTDNVASDGVDLEGSVLTDVDGYIDNAFDFVVVDDLPDPALVPGFAAVTFAPEPGSGSLAAAAALSLAWLRRRMRTAHEKR